MENFQKILKQITPEYSSIFWKTNSPLSEGSDFHEIIDYLVDGKIYDFIALNSESDNQIKYFISNNFGKPFLVFHSSTDFPMKDLIQIKKMIIANSDKESKCLIAAENSEALKNDLNKLKLKFDLLEL